MALLAIKRLSNPHDTSMATTVACLLFVGEAVLCGLIIRRVPYTEIDWVAYMQESEAFLQGERDYLKIRGQTGPLVYPAGFLYIYSALHWLTGGGAVAPAQLVFAALYLATQALVLYLYVASRAVPPWALPLLCASKRVHSIFVLRLFNDGVAMLVAYAATVLLLARRWRAAVLAFSAAVSVKMNVLLMAPAVLLVMLKGTTGGEVVRASAAGVVLQAVLGSPFLLTHPAAYLAKAFELSRVFLHTWSVNLKFLPEHVFQSKALAAGLLAAHLAVLWAFAEWRWCAKEGGVGGVLRAFWRRSTGQAQSCVKLQPQHVLLLVFTGNFIGIVLARTLHFQFYSWYFHTLPFLLWQTRLSNAARLSLWLCIEVVWNIFPSNAFSSLVLQACHLLLLHQLWCSPIPNATAEPLKKVA